MRIVGVGYRAEIIKNEINQILCFKIGLSHDFQYNIPKSVRVFLIEPTLICLYGVDKNQVTQIAAKIRQIKPPSVYKGKGIRLINEVIVMKPGKRK
jgi:large subunit ribosomal protein L6